ncbi:MAG TPA: polysaccharide deacetylase family protein, partial [Chryseolinea sp.]|nr:polysaccharide deacetylase family protein [Chryseolinea sp.]
IITLGLFLIYNQWANVPGLWYVVICCAYVGIQAYGSAVPSAEFFVPVQCAGPSASRAVSLTFDDGPVSGQTDEILRILRSYNTPAAFFCIGHKIKDNHDLIKKMHAEGHSICNHSYWHGYTFDLQSAGKIEKELADTDQQIHQAIGLKPAFFRPPYGVTNPMVAKAIVKRKYVTVGWSIRSFDTVIHDGDKLMQKITKSLKAGDVILLHDQSVTMVTILPALLEHIAAIGLKIVRLDELLKEPAYA